MHPELVEIGGITLYAYGFFIMIGALTFVAFLPESPMDEFTALPIQIFNWTARPQETFHELAAGGIIVLLTVLLLMNAVAVYIRYRGSRK